MPHSLAVLDSVRHSTLPHSEKTAIRRYYVKLSPRISGLAARAESAMGMSRPMISKAGSAVRSLADGAVTGAVLGAVKGQVGSLDINVPIGQGYTVPADVIAAGGLAALSVVGKFDIVSSDLRTGAAVCAASYTARQTEQWVANRKNGAADAGVHGEPDVGEDAIVEWARQQG